MQIAELAAQCVAAINSRNSLGLKGDDAVILITTPRGWKPPPKFPRRQIVQWKEDGTRVSYLPAVRTLAWLTANGLVKVALK